MEQSISVSDVQKSLDEIEALETEFGSLSIRTAQLKELISIRNLIYMKSMVEGDLDVSQRIRLQGVIDKADAKANAAVAPPLTAGNIVKIEQMLVTADSRVDAIRDLIDRKSKVIEGEIVDEHKTRRDGLRDIAKRVRQSTGSKGKGKKGNSELQER